MQRIYSTLIRLYFKLSCLPLLKLFSPSTHLLYSNPPLDKAILPPPSFAMLYFQYIKRPAVLKVITKTEKREKKIKFGLGSADGDGSFEPPEM